MSALLPKADIHRRQLHVRYVPEADILSKKSGRALQSKRVDEAVFAGSFGPHGTRRITRLRSLGH